MNRALTLLKIEVVDRFNKDHPEYWVSHFILVAAICPKLPQQNTFQERLLRRQSGAVRLRSHNAYTHTLISVT